MSGTNPTPPVEEPPVEPGTTGETATPEGTGTGEPDLGDPGKRAIEAERRARKAAEKAAADALKKIQEYEDRDKSEAQRAIERAEAAEARAAELEASTLRMEVAQERGLTPAQAKRLVGTTREELEADAAELLRDFPVAKERPLPPDPSQGVKPGGSNSLDALIAEAQAKGDWKTVISLQNQKLVASA